MPRAQVPPSRIKSSSGARTSSANTLSTQAIPPHNPQHITQHIAVPEFRSALLGWYHRHARPLPWRPHAATAHLSQQEHTYRIWLAEVMLQQTTVAAVIPYYHRFLEHFPTLPSLAAAPIAQVLTLWQGLGYYRRAHLLHRCAGYVVDTFGGQFPNTEAELKKLPGFGPYTAAAVAAQAFHQPASVLDGNVERVVARLYQLATPFPSAKPQAARLAAMLAEPTETPPEPAAFVNAIMELGATVCIPRNPLCLTCPVSAFCSARQHGTQALFPVKTKKATLPEKTGTAYLLTNPAGHILLRQRPAEGLLGGLWELPHTGWESLPEDDARLHTLLSGTPSPAEPITAPAIVHTFTHFRLTLQLQTRLLGQFGPLQTTALPEWPVSGSPTTSAARPLQWFPPEALPPLPTLMKKALARATAL